MTGHTRFLTSCAVMLLALLLYRTAAAKDEIAIIVASDAAHPPVNLGILRDIYLKKIFVDSNGRPFIPVNLPPDNPLRRGLAQALFNKSSRQLQDYWNQRYFQGVTPPYVLHSQEAVVQFVAKTPGAIGYIAACRLDTRVKQVLAISAPPAQRRALEKLCANGRDVTGSE
jgi:ABC-type phosphate transport system substrate-binding protein